MLAGTIGHFVEWCIYGLLAAVFASQIFPGGNVAGQCPDHSAVGFVVRPLSGVSISPLADRYGRRAVLATTIGGHGPRQPDHRAHPAVRRHRLRGAALGPDNVSVNCVCPGPVNTAMWDQLGSRAGGDDPDGNQRARQARAAQIPMGRFAESEEVAEAT